MQRHHTVVAGISAAAVLISAFMSVPLVSYSPAAEADGATNCVVARNRRGGGMELYNRCNGEIEVAWCLHGNNGCSRFNNQVTLGAGETYPISSESDHVEYIACAGANSLRHRGSKSITCD